MLKTSLLHQIEEVASLDICTKIFVILGQPRRDLKTKLKNLYFYEDLISEQNGEYEFPEEMNENHALGLCYTSGTTGNPKGVLYSHRSTFIAAIVTGMADTYAVSEKDIAMPIVPMFHVNAWGYPFVAALLGTTVVFPGRDLSPKKILDLLFTYQVTFAAGVPTIWLGVFHELKKMAPRKFTNLRVISGGAAVPPALLEAFDTEFGIKMIHAWGMTETHPLGAVSNLKSALVHLPLNQQIPYRIKQGLIVPGMEIRIVSEDGKVLPWDGQSVGEIQVRGPYIAKAYFNNPDKSSFSNDGWFKTGDVGSMDEEGYMKISDRKKDLIKSGGEWISSVELEGAIMAHPKVLEAAVVAVPHEKYTERPVALVVPQAKFVNEISQKDVIDFLQDKVAKWWLPDEILFVKEIPKTSVGKFDKKVIRDQYPKMLKAKL